MPGLLKLVHSKERFVFGTGGWLEAGRELLSLWNVLPDKHFCMAEALGHAIPV